MNYLYKFFTRLYISFFIVSCGGGGMGGSSSTPDMAPVLSPVITSFSATPEELEISNATTLNWLTSNTSSCEASGDWSGNKSLSGSEDLILNSIKTYTFILTCSGQSGTLSASKTITVVVTDSDASDIYNEDKDSYCRNPSNDSNEYWIENFNSNTFNSNIFTYQLGNGFNASDGTWIGGWGNNELQYYTGPGNGYAKNYNETLNTTENLFLENGFLKIQPIYDNTNVFNDPFCLDGSCAYTWEYTSARVMTSSKKLFKQPSELTVCFKVPKGTGHWPAVWLLHEGNIEGTKTWPYDGEIDIMEAKGRVSTEVGSTIHFGSSSNREMINRDETVPMSVNFHDKFHSITFKWTENSMKMFMDTAETPFFDVSSDSTEFNNNYYPFNEEFFLILNVASGSDYDGGSVDPSMYCNNEACSNLENPDNGRMLIDFIEYKSID